MATSSSFFRLSSRLIICPLIFLKRQIFRRFFRTLSTDVAASTLFPFDWTPETADLCQEITSHHNDHFFDDHDDQSWEKEVWGKKKKEVIPWCFIAEPSLILSQLWSRNVDGWHSGWNSGWHSHFFCLFILTSSSSHFILQVIGLHSRNSSFTHCSLFDLFRSFISSLEVCL